MSLLQMEQVEAYYGGIQALKGISLVVERGEIVTLIGSNGAGKSTTLKAICGQVQTKGKVMFGGSDITSKPPYGIALEGIAHVPEGGEFFPS